jgi:hypothetical protein
MQALTPVAVALLLAAACDRTGDTDRGASDSEHLADEMTCLTPPPLVGLRLGDSMASMHAAGQPVDSVRSVEGHGGTRAAAITYRFPQAEVRFVRGYVDRIAVTERGGWPVGLAVGSTRSEVDRYTGRHRLLRMTSGDTIEIEVCPGNRALLIFAPAGGDDRRVSRVELLAGRG